MIDVPIPEIVQEYNRFMGGVDKMDMNLALYRIDRCSNKWYMRIIFYLISLSVSNSWTLYKRHFMQRHGALKSSLSQKDFLLDVADARHQSKTWSLQLLKMQEKGKGCQVRAKNVELYSLSHPQTLCVQTALGIFRFMVVQRSSAAKCALPGSPGGSV